MADDEELATQRFDCTSCERKAWVDALWPENIEALAIFAELTQPSVHAFGLGPYLVEAWTAGYRADEKRALVTRLNVIQTYASDA